MHLAVVDSVVVVVAAAAAVVVAAAASLKDRSYVLEKGVPGMIG